jgi:hypothetical protein
MLGPTILLYGPSSTLYSGASSAEPWIPRTVNIDGDTFAVTLAGYERSSQESLAETAINAAEPSDKLFNTQGAWWRYRFRWDHGQGQKSSDLGDTADTFRYEESLGLNVWEPHELRLLTKVNLAFDSTSAATDEMHLNAVNGEMCFSYGNKLVVGSGVSWTNVPGITGIIRDTATDGVSLFLATDNNLYRYSFGVLSTIHAVTTSAVGFVAGRLLTARDNAIGEVSAAGVWTSFYTHYSGNFSWTSIFQIGSRIYIGGNAGTRCEVFLLTTTSTGQLAVGPEAVTLPVGEFLFHVETYAGSAALLCTSSGVRLALIGGDGALDYGPVISDPGAVRMAVAEGRFAYFPWSSPFFSENGVGRLALDTFVGEGQTPAYARDVMAVPPVFANVLAVGRLNFVTYYALDAGALYYAPDSGTYRTYGYMDSGKVFFGTVEDKIHGELEVKSRPLDTATSVVAKVLDQDWDEMALVSIATPSSQQAAVDLSGALVANGGIAAYSRVTTELFSTAGVLSPTVTQWRMRAFPVVPGVEQWVVSILLTSKVVVNDGMGQQMSIDTRDAAERLIARWRSKRFIAYREGDRLFYVRVDNYKFTATDWRDTGDFFEGVLTLRLVRV